MWGLVEDITPIPYPIDKLDHTLDWEVWGSEVISPRKLLEHYAQTIESDLHYPIIISVNSWGAVSHIYDGFHRLVKAKYKGYEKIMVKIVEEDILTQPNNYISVEELVCEMVSQDLSLAKKEVLIVKEGFDINSPKENPPSIKK